MVIWYCILTGGVGAEPQHLLEIPRRSNDALAP
jgi:hypothetical protein